MTCTVFIDESGDTGITKIRDQNSGGSSPFFCLGAVVMRRATQIETRKLLDQLQEDFRKTKRWKHATDLNHAQKVHFAKTLAAKRLRFYGLISNKSTLEEYKSQIDWDPHKFYNKCITYLLELVGADLIKFSNEFLEPQIVVEQRNHNYDTLRRYIVKVKENPIYPESKYLSAINPFGLIAKSKDEEDLLRVADFVAHSLYSCVNKTPDNFGHTEPRYWNELSSRFATDNNGKVLGSGIKCIHSLEQVDLDADVAELISQARGKPTQLER
jgi:hypothetical protein